MVKKLVKVITLTALFLILSATIVFADVTVNNDNINIQGSAQPGERLSLMVTYGGLPVYVDECICDTDGKYALNFSFNEVRESGEYVALITGIETSHRYTFNYEKPSSGQIDDNFTSDLSKWRIEDDSVYIDENGYFSSRYSRLYNYCTAYLTNDKIKDACVEYEFKYTDRTESNSWIAFHTRKGDKLNSVMLRNTGVYVTTPDRNDFKIIEYSFEKDVFYNIKIDFEGINYKVYVKKAADSEYVVSGEFTTSLVSAGAVGFRTNGMPISIRKVSVNNKELGTFISERLISGDVGTSQKVTVTNWGFKNYSLTSEDESICTVEADGTVNLLKTGETEIVVSSENGEIYDSCKVVVKSASAWLSPSHNSLDMNIGDRMNVNVTMTGNKYEVLKWSVNDSDIIRLYGDGNLSRTVEAVGSGVACITVSAVNSGITTKIYVVSGNAAASNERASLFEPSESGTLNKMVFGNHQSAGDNSANLIALYNDLKYNIIRSGYNPPVTDDAAVIKEYDDKFFASAEETNTPMVVALLRTHREHTTEEILAQVERICERLGDIQDTIYLEFGNETYFVYENVEDYIEICRNLYAPIKAYGESIGKEIKLAISLKHSEDWDSVIAQNADCYDAVVLHNYTNPSHLDAMNETQVLSGLFNLNRRLVQTTEEYETKFEGKELWITEFGHHTGFMYDMSNLNERARYQIGKGVGAALVNAEKLLEFSINPEIAFANYHISNDSQGFGVYQNDTKLPMYYIFKQLGNIINSSDKYWKFDTVYCNTPQYTNNLYQNYKTTFIMEDIGLWGYGDEDGIKYAVALNRSPNANKVHIDGYELKPVWSYGGEGLFDNFLKNDIWWMDPPSDVPLPVYPETGYASSYLVDGFTMVIFELLSADTDICVIDVADGETGVNTKRAIGVTFNNAKTPEEVEESFSITKADGTEILFETEKISDYKYELVPLSKFACFEEYIVESSVYDIDVRFETEFEDFDSKYITEFIVDDFSNSENYADTLTLSKNSSISGKKFVSSSNNAVITTQDSYDRFTLEFSFNKVSNSNSSNESARPQVRFNWGGITFWMRENDFQYWRSSGASQTTAARMGFVRDKDYDVRIVAGKGKIEIYGKESCESNYTLYTTVTNTLPNAQIKLWGADCDVHFKSVELYRERDSFNAQYYQYVGDAIVPVNKIVKGTTYIDLTSDEKLEDTFIANSLFDGNIPIQIHISDLSTGNAIFTITTDGSENYVNKLFIWDLDLTPLSRVRIFR